MLKIKKELIGKDLLCTQDWTQEDLIYLLNLALKFKRLTEPADYQYHLFGKNFLMLFYSPSIRTHLSFLSAVTQLGGHAQYLSPNMGRFHSPQKPGEIIKDIARVMSGFINGLGIRIMEQDVERYGLGHELIREFAHYADIPVVNMADDVCHPCQALADILTWAEWFAKDNNSIDFTQLKQKRLLLTWSKGRLARSWNSPQATLLLASRLGMDITLARPEGYDLDTAIYHEVNKNLASHAKQLTVTNSSTEGYNNADIVYSRHWLSSHAYANGKPNRDKETKQALALNDWITTTEKMAITNNAIFTHPMPVDRNYEVDDAVVDGPNSVIYQVARNRLWVQKALLYTIMGDN